MNLRLLTGILFSLVVSCVVKAQPVAAFSSNKTSGCSPLTVQFSDASIGSPTAFEWDFGNGNSSIIRNPSATYVTPGTYTVTLKATNASGSNTVVKTAYITVFKNPVADFTMSVTGGCAPLNVSFTSTSVPGSGAISQYLWDYGDGNLDNTQSTPTHTYVASGWRTLSLTVTDINGCQHTTTKTNAIQVTQTHTVAFTGTNLFSCSAPLSSAFTSTVSPAGTYTYLWTTSNGLNSGQQNPSFTFNTPGEYDISLKVTNSTGCSETVTKNKMVAIAGPVAGFNASTLTTCTGKEVTFTNTTTPQNSTINYQWNVNGSPLSANPNFSYTPAAAGTYTVTLKVNDRGCPDSRTETIVVAAGPKATFTAAPAGFCRPPATINFINNSTPSGLQYAWTFGNGQTSSAQQPSTTYTSMGTYPVKLIVSSASGCTDTATFTVKSADPVAEIVQRNLKTGCAPLNAFFRLLPGQAASFTRFEWKYKNNVISTDSQFNYTFPDTGIHVVTLRAVTAEGCEVVLRDSIRVGKTFTFDFSGDKRTGCYSTLKQVHFKALGSGPDNLVFNWYWKSSKIEGKEATLPFNDTGTYSIKLSVSHYGCVTEVEKAGYVVILPARASFITGPISCANDSVTFTNSSVGRNKYTWIFGDGDSAVRVHPRHIYTAPGVYTVTLIAVDTVHLCPDTVTKQVVIPEAPVLGFSVSDTIGCAPFTVPVTNLTTVGPNGYPITGMVWSFTNGANGSMQENPVPTFTQPGYVRISLNVTDQRGCSYTLSRDSVIKIISGNARVGLALEKGCAPLTTLIFDSSETEYPVVERRWFWSATDSLVRLSGAPFSRTFPVPGIPQSAGHTITLVVTDSFGCRFSATRKIVPSKPAATFTFSRDFRCGEQQVTFSGPTADEQVYKPAQYTWTVGNIAGTGTGINAVFNHLDTIYQAKLVVKDANGCSTTIDSLLPVMNRKPLSGFYASPPKLDCYTPVRPVKLFDTTVLGSTPIKNWRWVVGPNVSDKQNPEFVFARPGKYGVKLWIEDSAGCVDSLVIPDYVVIGGPVGTYSFTPNKGCMPHKVSFSVSSPNARYYIWDLADGYVDTVETANFEYVYPRAGVYYPRLTLVDSSGTCAYGYDAIDSIVVHPLPKPEFDADKSVVCINSLVTFHNKTPGAAKIHSWLWVINDTDTLTGATPPPQTFSVPGKYKVSLTATDVNTCADSVVKADYITVINDTIPPEIPVALRATVLDNTTNVVEIRRNTEVDFMEYRFLYNYVSGVHTNTVAQLIDDTIFRQQGINTLENPYSYAVAAMDVCNNLSLPSEVHTTVEVKAASTENAVAVKWTPYAGFDTIARYEVWRNNADSGNQYVFINRVSADTLHYTDTNITCFTTYYYRIKTIEQGGHEQFSWSDTSGAVPDYVSTMPSTQNIRATVVNDSYVLLQWNKRTHKVPFAYLVYRMRDDETVPVAYRQTNDTFLVDDDVKVDEHSYTYYTYLKDSCGGLSPASNQSKTILLKVNLKENDLLKHDPVIDFTSYQAWSSGVKEYAADFYYDSARAFSPVTTLQPSDTQFFHRYVNLQQRDYCYKVTAYEDVPGGVTSESNIACIDTKPRLYAPSAFTINGDGLNEQFELGGVFLDTYHIRIYTRWGQLIFESDDIHTSWDGTIEGKPAPADVYVYLAEGTGRHNQRITLKGNVTLLR